MFDKLIDILREIWSELIPIEVIHPYNGGIQLRMGKFLRVLEGGKWYWKIPFADATMTDHVVPRTERLTGLATTTVDGKAIGFDAVITYRISDIQKALLEVSALKDAIADSCAGIIGTELSNTDMDGYHSRQYGRGADRGVPQAWLEVGSGDSAGAADRRCASEKSARVHERARASTCLSGEERRNFGALRRPSFYLDVNDLVPVLRRLRTVA